MTTEKYIDVINENLEKSILKMYLNKEFILQQDVLLTRILSICLTSCFPLIAHRLVNGGESSEVLYRENNDACVCVVVVRHSITYILPLLLYI